MTCLFLICLGVFDKLIHNRVCKQEYCLGHDCSSAVEHMLSTLRLELSLKEKEKKRT